MLRRNQRKTADSIYDRIRAAADHGGVGLIPSELGLPDEPPRRDDQLRWIDGGLDGVTGHHFGSETDESVAAAVAGAIRTLAAGHSDQAALELLHDTSRSAKTMSYVDRLPDLLQRDPAVDRAAVRTLGHRLATTSLLREEVKLGIALIGFAGVADFVDVILVLGRHEEFTLFAAVALTKGFADPEAAMWSLALHVDGWGRIQTVKRLAGTANPQIKAWLLREGFRNRIMDEYLAYTAATTGELLEALRAEDLDDQVWHGARDIISALIAGGPAEDMNDYADGGEATELLLKHAARRDLTVTDFNVIASILGYVVGAETDKRLDYGWTEGRRALLRAACQELLAPSRWHDQVHAALQTTIDREFWEADRAAHTLGIPTFAVHLARLEADPGNAQRWYLVMRDCRPGNIHRVIELAQRVLPLDDIATGIGDSLGLGPAFESHRCLDAVLQDLRRFPRNGWILIRAGLGSPVVRNRNMALKALQAWDPGDWPPEAERLLQDATVLETNEKTRELIEELLRAR